MSDIGNVGSSGVWTALNYQTAGLTTGNNQVVVSAQDQDGDNDGSGQVSGGTHAAHGHHRAFMQGLFQTMQQLGLVPANQSAGPGNTAGDQDGDKDGGSGATPEVRQAFQTFMHGLFQALNQSGDGGLAAAGTPTNDGTGENGASADSGQSGKGTLVSALQGLLQRFTANGTGTAQDNSLSTLNTNFQNLVQTLNGNAANPAGSLSNPSRSQETLQAFLQTFIQNLQNPQLGSSASALGAPGSIVSASA